MVAIQMKGTKLEVDEEDFVDKEDFVIHNPIQRKLTVFLVTAAVPTGRTNVTVRSPSVFHTRFTGVASEFVNAVTSSKHK